jgi:hypothetical protein
MTLKLDKNEKKLDRLFPYNNRANGSSCLHAKVVIIPATGKYDMRTAGAFEVQIKHTPSIGRPLTVNLKPSIHRSLDVVLLLHGRRAYRCRWNANFTSPPPDRDHSSYKVMLVSWIRPSHLRAAVQRGDDEIGVDIE